MVDLLPWKISFNIYDNNNFWYSLFPHFLFSSVASRQIILSRSIVLFLGLQWKQLGKRFFMTKNTRLWSERKKNSILCMHEACRMYLKVKTSTMCTWYAPEKIIIKILGVSCQMLRALILQYCSSTPYISLLLSILLVWLRNWRKNIWTIFMKVSVTVWIVTVRWDATCK